MHIRTLHDAHSLSPHFTCVFPSSLCVFLHLVHDLYPPSASRQTSPYFCACLCVFSRPRAGPEGPVEGDWGYGALSSCCGFLSKTWLKNDGRYLSEPHQICRSHILLFFPTWSFLKQVRILMPSFLSSPSPALCFPVYVLASHWTFWMRVNLWSLNAQGKPEGQM